MVSNPFDKTTVLNIGRVLNRGYASKDELLTTLDHLQFALFFLDTGSILPDQQQNFACLVQLLKEGLCFDENDDNNAIIKACGYFPPA